MKTSRFSQIIVLALLELATPMFAQNPVVRWGANDSRPSDGKAVAAIPDARPVYAVQNCRTLETSAPVAAELDSSVDHGALSQPFIHQKRQVMTPQWQDSNADSDARTEDSLALLAAAYRENGKSSGGRECSSIALSVQQKIRRDVDSVLEIVEAEVAGNPSCACEIVKSAIQSTGANPKLVVDIVETSIGASPENMRLISQCAVAAAPDSLIAIHELLAKLDPNGGDSATGSESAKQAIAAAVQTAEGHTLPNPLDLPRWLVIPPMSIQPAQVTHVDP